MKLTPSTNAVKYAPKHRANLTRSEKAALQRFEKLNIQVACQIPISCYILDFVDLQAFRVFEIDGSSHRSKKQRAKDIRRDEFLRKHGVQVIRISNHASRHTNGVFEKKAALPPLGRPVSDVFRRQIVQELAKAGYQPGAWAIRTSIEYPPLGAKTTS